MKLQFKIQIKGLSGPTVWRRVLVPETFTFEKFHHVIQGAFGWENSHLYQFSPKGYGSFPCIGIPEDDGLWLKETDDASETYLNQYFYGVGQKYTYIYDFGDDWTHTILLEKIFDENAIRAELIKGKGACPPEDCGGIWGYYSLLDVLDNPKHEEYKELRQWLGLKRGEKWDPDFFDFEAAKLRVAQV